MTYYIELPNGTDYRVDDDTIDPEMAMAMAKDQFPDAFKGPEGGYKAAARSGWEQLKGAGAVALGRAGIMDTEAAEQYRTQRQREANRIFAPESKGIMETPWQELKELAGQSTPYMAAPLLAGAAATALGATAPLAAGAAGLASATQFSATNMDRQVEAGKKIADVDAAAAVAAAIPMAALDMLGFKMMPGIRQIMGLAGKEVTEATAKRIATQGLKEIAKDYTAATGKAMGTEGLTEAAQQFLERLQAGLNIKDAAAREEYYKSFVGGAALGGALSPAGRFVERTQERGAQEAKITADKRAAAEKQAEELAAQEQARRADPAYITELLARAEAHQPTLAKLREAAKAAYDKTDPVAAAAHQEAVDALNAYRSRPEVQSLTDELRAARPQIDAYKQSAAEAEAAKLAEAERPRTDAEVAQMRQQLDEAVQAHAAAVTAAKDAVRSGDMDAHALALEEVQRQREAMTDLNARIPPPAPPAPPVPALAVLQKQLKQRIGAYDRALATDAAAAAQIAQDIATLHTQINDVTPAYTELSARDALLRQEKPSKAPVNPMARFMEDSALLDVERAESEGIRNTVENDRLAEEMTRGRMDASVTRQALLFPRTVPARGQRYVSGSGAQGRTAAELQAELQIARATGNKAAARAAADQLRQMAAEQSAAVQKFTAAPTSEVTQETAAAALPLGEQGSVSRLPKRVAQQQGAGDARALSFAALVRALSRFDGTPAAVEARKTAINGVRANLVSEVNALRDTPLPPEAAKALTAQANDALHALVEGFRTTASPDALIARTRNALNALRDVLLPQQEESTTDTTPRPVATTPDTLQRQLDTLPTDVQTQYAAPLEQVRAHIAGLARHAPEETAEFLHAARMRNNTEAALPPVLDAISRLKDATLETTKEADTAQRGLFVDTALQSRVFPSREAFVQFMASDQLKQLRADVGLVTDTAERLARRLAPFEKKLANVKQQIAAAMDRGAAGTASIAVAQQRMQELTERLAKEREALQYAHDHARAAFERATAKSQETQLLIHENQTAMEAAHAEVETAAVAVDEAQEVLAQALMKDVNKTNYAALQAAKRGIVAAINARLDMSDRLDSTTVTFLRSDLRLQMELQEQLDSLRAMHDVLVTARLDLAELKQAQARSTTNRRQHAAAQKALAAAQEEVTTAQRIAGAYAADIHGVEATLQANRLRMAQRAQQRADAANGRVADTLSAREARDGDIRREEQARRERLELLPGERIDMRARRDAEQTPRATLERTERKQLLADKAEDATLPQTTRDKARRTWLRMDREDRIAEGADAAQLRARELVETRIPQLEQKVRANETKANKQELAKARRELATLQRRMAGVTRTPVGGRREQLATEPVEAGTRLEPGRAGPVTRKERIAGELRTGTAESAAGENKVGTRNKLQEVRRVQERNRAVSAEEMNAANAAADSITQATAAEDMAREQARRAREQADDAHIAAQAEQAAQKALPKAMKRAPRAARALEDFYTDDFAGEYEAAFFRTAAPGGKGVDIQVVQDAVEQQTAKWKAIPPIVYVQSEKQLPLRIQGYITKVGKNGNVPGLLDSKTGKVFIIGDNVKSPQDAVLTVIHEVAGHYGLRGVLGADYEATMNRLYAGHAAVKQGADAKMAADATLTREVAVEELLAELAEAQPKSSIVQRLLFALKTWLHKNFGYGGVSDADLLQIVANARRYVERGGNDGPRGGGTPPPVLRTADFGAYADTPIGGSLTQGEKDSRSFWQRWTDGLGMALETGIVDMHAPLMRALHAAGDTKDTMQAKYAVREVGALAGWVQSFLSYGAPEIFKDSKGFTGVRASAGISGADVMRAAEAIPGGNTEGKFVMATEYMVAQRGSRVGADKVGLKADGTPYTQADLDAVLQQVERTPELKKALERFREVYNQYNERLVNFARDTGALSAEKSQELLEHGDYVPMYRLRDGMLELSFGDNDYVAMGDIANSPFLHQLRGGDEKIMPINESLIYNTKLLTELALKNLAQRNVGYALAAAGRASGIPGKMQVRYGKAPRGKEYLSWRIEPEEDTDTGERYIKVDTAGTVMEGVPSDVLAKSIEGVHATMPAYVQWAAKLNDWVRAGVTRMPPYTVRQLLRDPFSAASTSGMKANPLTAVGRAIMEYRKGMFGDKTALEAANRHALVQSNLFTGDPDDMIKLTHILASGQDPNAVRKLLNTMDRSAHVADAATRIQVYNDGLAQGLSEVEAAYRTRESMNFHKRGAWSTVQHANRMLPFFNSGIQALNVSVKALQGKMPFEEQLRIKQTFVRNALLLTVSGAIYAAMMQDDEDYTKLRPGDRYGNFHVGIPGSSYFLRIPIGYADSGGMAWAAGQALVESMNGSTEGKQIVKALGRYGVSATPGGGAVPLPTGMKQFVEWVTNTDLRTFTPIVGGALSRRAPEAQHDASTPEAFKALGMAGLSPKQAQHALDGLTGSAASVALTLLDMVTGAGDKADVDKPALSVHKLPWVKSFVQNPHSSGAAEVVYDLAEKAQEVKSTFDAMRRKGHSPEELREYQREHRVELAVAARAGAFVQRMGEINTLKEQVTNAPRGRYTAEQKRDALERLDRMKADTAYRYMQELKRVEQQARAASTS